jgi:FdhE protein
MVQSAKTYPQVETAVHQLDELAKRKPELAEAAAFYRQVIPLLHQAQQAVPAFALDPALAQQKLAMGRPLLVGEDLPLDGIATADLFLRLCRIAEKAGLNAYPIRRAVEKRQLSLLEVWGAVAMGNLQLIEQTAVQLRLSPGLLRVLAENSLKPALRAWVGACDGMRLRWRYDEPEAASGRCPMCGAPPALAEIQGKEGARRLRCGLCGAGWHFPRLQCAFCGGRDHRMLGYIALDGEEEKYRLQTCDHCRHYLKVVVTFDPIPVDLLIVEDLATLHLDHIAQERNFTHP